MHSTSKIAAPRGQDEIDPKLRDRKPVEFGSADDHQLRQALNLLQGRTVEVAKAKDESGSAPNGGDKAAK
ncbi:MAG: hypothetical protein ABS55_10080 [Lautropia sp. SCN 70-15]|nr:MAG: hypothetical protein ABS55_10080 [Lautropia sp. SCN 70-15]